MCDSSSLTRKKSLLRVNSGGEEFDTQSEYIGGNLNLYNYALPWVIEEEDLLSDEEEEENFQLLNIPITLEDYVKADIMLSKEFGINILEHTAKSLLSDKIKPRDIVIQGLAYRIQKLCRGKNGIRYLPSWGHFWAGIREIVKSRGLVPFLDHFEVRMKYFSILKTFRFIKHVL